jgi:4-amino-4-deoxy-L-arabinose transferase-like glycosyltransferase
MTGRTRWWLWMLFVVALAARLLYVGLGGAGQSPDNYREYVIAGQKLLKHGAIVSPFVPLDSDATSPSSLLPPIYTGIVAGAYWLLGVESPAATLALRLLNALATAAIVFPVFSVGQSLGGRRAGWLAAVIAALNPAVIGFVGLIWDTSLLTLGVCITAWWSWRLAAQRPSAWGWTGFGLWLGALAVFNPALTIAYPLFVLFPALRHADGRMHGLVVPVAATLLGWGVAITPWTVRNLVVLDELMYIRGGLWLEVWLGVCPEASGTGNRVYPTHFPLLNPDQQQRVAVLGEAAYIDEAGRMARAAIAADPLRFVHLSALRFVDYWAGTVFTHTTAGESRLPSSRARQVVLMVLLAETVVLLLGLLRWRRLPPGTGWLLGVIALFPLVYYFTHTAVRFRAPIEPLVGLIVAVVLVGLIRRRGHAPPAAP